MEQSRLILAIALSFLVFFIWEMLTVDKEPQHQNAQTRGEKKTASTPTPLQEKITPGNSESTDTERKEPSPRFFDKKEILTPDHFREITVKTPLYETKISEKGAVVNSFILKKYRTRIEKDSPFLEMVEPVIQSGTLQFEFENRSVHGLADAVYVADVTSEELIVEENNTELTFHWMSPEGIWIEKTFTFTPDSYLIGLKINVKNGSNETIRDRISLSLKKVFSETKQTVGFSGPSTLIDNKLEQVKLKDIEDKNRYSGEIKWLSLEDRYFISCIIPETPVPATMILNEDDKKIVENQYVTQETDIGVQEGKAFSFKVFFGPKDTRVLKKIDYDLSKAINFGMFDVIAKPCVSIMNFLYSVIPNYGVAIIILTLMTKILLWPLGNKSYKSMAEMKKIQPLMNEIREKYKDDKQKMNQEIMGLYRIYKVNPLGGCLPMVVQIPIFFALYRMLYSAIELRHAPFFGWINDLSAPDRLFHFSFSIPFMAPPYGIPVLTIIMGGTMFLSQKMQPPMGDPAQAKMMMLMPIIFTVIFINFSSGLVLYWLVNNIISIGQQYYITKKKA